MNFQILLSPDQLFGFGIFTIGLNLCIFGQSFWILWSEDK